MKWTPLGEALEARSAVCGVVLRVLMMAVARCV